ncbi:MAG: T9SS type A sorting domain-containing protein [Bacteroidota bacterium]|jgi:hypothetical protein
MHHILLTLIIVATLLSGGVHVLAQDVPDSKGRDFWFTFLPNFHNGEQQGLNDPAERLEHELQIYIGAERPTKGTISWRTQTGVTRSAAFTITDPAVLYRFAIFYGGIELKGISGSGASIDFLNSQNERVAQQHFHVVADDDVTVYALNQAPLTSEAFLVLPTDAVANDYVVMSYTTDIANSLSNTVNPATTPSQFAVVATEDSTVVTIDPTAPTPRNPSAEPFTVTLQKGESFLVQADPRANPRGDLTGSRVRSTKPVAVFAGHNRALLPIELRGDLASRDCLIEQMNPVRTWGKSAFVTPMALPSTELGIGYDIFRVVAGFDSTEVFVDGQSRRILMAGEFYEGRLLGAYEITTSRPSLTAQYKATSGDPPQQNDPDVREFGDPFMMLVPPAEQFMSSYRFINLQSYEYNVVGTRAEIIDSVYLEQWMNVVIPSDRISTLVLDGSPVDPGLFRPIGSSGFSYAQVRMSDGVHEIKADTLFGIYVYGYGEAVSYGYIGGMAFRPLDVYPPVISGALECNVYRGAVVDTVIADTKVREVNVQPGAVNAVLELDGFNPPQGVVKYAVRLVNPYEDGSLEFIAVDGVKQRERRRVQIPGFTVAIASAGSSATLTQRSSVVAVGRERCDSIEIENYGKFSRTFTASFRGATRVDALQPMTLAAGERRMLRYCRAGTAEQVTIDTLVFSDSCLQRPVAVMTFEERLDEKGPQVERDVDVCDSVTIVTISDERSSDLGLRSVTILDSVLLNCSVNIISDAGEVLIRKYAVKPFDRYADVIYGFEAVDSIGNVSRIIDTIPGFRMSIDGVIDSVVRHAFDTTVIGSMACDTIPLENLGILGLNIPNAYLRSNTIFSAPQGQFGISLASNGGKGALVVCFSPILGDTSKVLSDTVDFEINCRLRRLILNGVGRRNTLSGLSRCDVPVGTSVRKLSGALVTPQPAQDRFTVTFTEPDVRSATIRLVDLTGVVRWERSWSGEPTSAVQIDCSDVPAGLYACQILTSRTQVVSVLISR